MAQYCRYVVSTSTHISYGHSYIAIDLGPVRNTISGQSIELELVCSYDFESHQSLVFTGKGRDLTSEANLFRSVSSPCS